MRQRRVRRTASEDRSLLDMDNRPRLVIKKFSDVELKPYQAEAGTRLDADRARFEELCRADFKGHAWKAFCDDLWEYAMPVLKAGMRTGSIFKWCWDHDIIVESTDDERRTLHGSMEDRDELAIESIAGAIVAFRKNTLERRRWKPTKRASLRTFFIGACLVQFGQVFRHWRRERVDRLAGFGYGVAPALLASELADQLTADPEQYTITAELLTKCLKKADIEVKMSCYLVLQGHTLVETAELLGVSDRVIEGRFYRLRKHVKTLVKQGRVEIPGFLGVGA